MTSLEPLKHRCPVRVRSRSECLACHSAWWPPCANVRDPHSLDSCVRSHDVINRCELQTQTFLAASLTWFEQLHCQGRTRREGDLCRGSRTLNHFLSCPVVWCRIEYLKQEAMAEILLNSSSCWYSERHAGSSGCYPSRWLVETRFQTRNWNRCFGGFASALETNRGKMARWRHRRWLLK